MFNGFLHPFNSAYRQTTEGIPIQVDQTWMGYDELGVEVGERVIPVKPASKILIREEIESHGGIIAFCYKSLCGPDLKVVK